MVRSLLRFTILVVGLAALPGRVLASPLVIDFEAFGDGDSLTTQIPGLTFLNATVLTAGISLNEFEFPPFSGTNVAIDDGGPMRIDFASSIASFSGRFTYLSPLLLEAFNASDVLLGSVASLFSNNLALSGDSGSAPNELLQLSGVGISYVTITGETLGGSFAMDDASIDASAAVPEPSTLSLLALGGAGLVCRWRRRR
jgi:hypothetical protein